VLQGAIDDANDTQVWRVGSSKLRDDGYRDSGRCASLQSHCVTPNGLRFTGANRARRPWLLEHSKAAVRVRCNRLVGRRDP
jgi:hypothetical protein